MKSADSEEKNTFLLSSLGPFLKGQITVLLAKMSRSEEREKKSQLLKVMLLMFQYTNRAQALSSSRTHPMTLKDDSGLSQKLNDPLETHQYRFLSMPPERHRLLLALSTPSP